jgi:hypothetical protein
MRVSFRTYCGEAGSLDELLIAESESGVEESTFIPRTGWFRHYRMRLAKKKLLKRLELVTGKKHVE